MNTIKKTKKTLSSFTILKVILKFCLGGATGNFVTSKTVFLLFLYFGLEVFYTLDKRFLYFGLEVFVLLTRGFFL